MQESCNVLMRRDTSPDISVRREKALSSSGCESRPATVAPAGSNRSNRGGNEAVEAFGVEGPSRDLAIVQAVTRVNVEQASKGMTWKLTRRIHGESRRRRSLESDRMSLRVHRGNDDGMYRRKQQQPREAPAVKARDLQPKAREGQIRAVWGDGEVRSSEEAG